LVALDSEREGGLDLRLVGPQSSWIFPDHRLLGEGPVGTIVLARRRKPENGPIVEELVWIRQEKASLRVSVPAGWKGLAVTRPGEVLLVKDGNPQRELALLTGTTMRPLRAPLPAVSGKITSATPSFGGGGFDLTVGEGREARLFQISP
jgi:hypothetical protein